MSQTREKKTTFFGFRSLIGCWGKCDEWLKLHWQKFLRWIAIFELLLTIVILPFTILNGSGSWLKLDQMTSTLTRNLVKMDNLYFIPLFPVLSVIIFAGLGIKNVVISKYHWPGPSGREQARYTKEDKAQVHIDCCIRIVCSLLSHLLYVHNYKCNTYAYF